MSIREINGNRFAEMVLQGATHLANHAKIVDSLNVFPVPDGDTGTNMNLSMTSGAKEVRKNLSDHIGKVGVSLSKGLLMGARGNSGVILSQLFRGFSKAIENKQQITSIEFAGALEAGIETAYKAVMKPVEGTILTVAKDAAKRALQVAKKQEDIIIVMEEVLKEAKASLNRTPDLLPILKEVGVVDSGGQGLVFVYEGFLATLKGEALPSREQLQLDIQKTVTEEHHHQSVQSHLSTEDIVFGYCTEFMVKFEEDKLKAHPFNEEKFSNDLSKYGDSLLVIADEELVKVHIHSEHPGEVLSYGQKYGSLINMKIENMREQHSHIINEENSVLENSNKKRELFGIITVAMGEGIEKLFKSIGAHIVISGGQTMNPSTEDFINAIKEVNAETVVILPNNKNIIMAAEQAASVSTDKVIVIPSKTVPQGLSALLAFNPGASIENNQKIMTDTLLNVKTGQVTYAVRDTNIDGLNIAKGHFMGLQDGKITVSNENMLMTAKELIKNMIDEDDEILTIIQGNDASQSDVDELVSFVEAEFEEVEIEVHIGNQPLYSFIFSVE